MKTKITLAALAVAGMSALVARPADASCVPGFDYAMFAKDSLHIQGNAGTDSYDSSAGTYATTNACADADFGTNSTAAGAAYLQGNSTVICGDGFVGAGGNPAMAITGNGNVTGGRGALTTNLALPNVAIPALANGAPVSPSFQNVNATLAPDRTYGAVSCKNGSLTLSAGRYVVQSLSLTSGCELTVGSGPVEIYFLGSLSMHGGTVVNPTTVPSNLVIYGGTAATGATMQGGATSSFAVYAPTADCELHGNVDVFGAFVCRTMHVQGNAHIHYDRALQSVAGGGFTCPLLEVSRATPIVAAVAGQPAVVQGTFDSPTGTRTTITTVASIATFSFPYLTGHLRARTAASITTTSSSFAAGTVLFDAGATGRLPTVDNTGCNSFNGTCRNRFTVTQTPAANGTSFRPPRVQLRDSNASAIGALIAPPTAVPGIAANEWRTIVRMVLAGALGGVDRSTVAVIPASALAGSATRPTIAYVGATDGMLHAVCASVGGTTETQTNVCPSLGTELWAFLPRVQLPLVRKNTTRVDGSVRVVDAFGDFVNNPATGARRFRTILTLQTGYADATIGAEAAVYALDVTDPANPIVLWEYTRPSTPGSFELGVGLSLAAGPTLVGGQPTNLVVAQTSNGGTGGPGIVATALALETGTPTWKFGYAYPSPPRGNAADLPLPTTGVPGGAVGVDLTQQGYTTDIVMGDLYGNLWRLDAATGTSRTGTGVPLFQFSTNKHPIGAVPAIYSDGNAQLAAFGSGGYADPLTAAWSAGTQSLIAISLTAPGPYPIAETANARLAFRQNLGVGEKASAQVLVVGNQLFLTTDTTDINNAAYGTAGNTGRVVSYDLATAVSTTVVVRGGAGSLASSGTTLYSSSSDRQQALATPATSTIGASVDTNVLSKLQRVLWLRTQ
ncbi:MAG: hypothetical protein M3680_19780 [Myxococcota bacterium]|nr:hypothetical protein [Myxococcota bacterium]